MLMVDKDVMFKNTDPEEIVLKQKKSLKKKLGNSLIILMCA